MGKANSHVLGGENGSDGLDELAGENGFGGSVNSMVFADCLYTGFTGLLGFIIPTDDIAIGTAFDINVTGAITGNEMSAVAATGAMFSGVGDILWQIVSVAVVGFFIGQFNYFSSIIFTIFVEVETEHGEFVHVLTQATDGHVTGVRHRWL